MNWRQHTYSSFNSASFWFASHDSNTERAERSIPVNFPVDDGDLEQKLPVEEMVHNPTTSEVTVEHLPPGSVHSLPRKNKLEEICSLPV